MFLLQKQNSDICLLLAIRLIIDASAVHLIRAKVDGKLLNLVLEIIELSLLQFDLMKRATACRRKVTFKQNLHSNSLSYSQFTFKDNLTNKKIMLRDAQEQFGHSQSLITPAEPDKRQTKELRECVSLLKTTKVFQMNSLRNKLFKSVHHSRTPNPNCQSELATTKRGLKKIIETTIDEINRKQFQEWLVDSRKRITPQVMSLHNISGHRITKSNLIDILNGEGKSAEEGPVMMPKNTKNEAPVELKGEKDLREKIQFSLAAIRANNSYLVRPNTQQELYQKLHNACRNKRYQLQKKKISEKAIDTKEEGVFQPIKAGENVDALEKRLIAQKKKVIMPEDERQLIYAVENNLFFDMELLINTKPNLAHCRDRKGNNLLHIAAKNRNQHFFEFIIKRTGPQALKGRNNLGKTPLDIAKLYGVEGIVNFINNYGPYY